MNKKLHRLIIVLAAAIMVIACGFSVFAVDQIEQEITTNVSVASNAELFSDFVEAKLMSEKTPTKAGKRGKKLTGINRAIYDSLIKDIALVADGTNSSTVFSVSKEALGIENYRWTAADLGVSKICEGNSLTQDAKAAITDKLGINMHAVINALLSDYPYEMYWFDKVQGSLYMMPGMQITMNNTIETLNFTDGITVSFIVASAYSAGEYKVNTTNAQRVGTAVENAKAIVQNNKTETDYAKLDNYKKAICNLVSYDSSAMIAGTAYGDPWQIVSVFDNDNATNVVCEGYAKAFQYLCNLTSFDGHVSCISVLGTMSGGSGSGRHMWNVVHMSDAKNYLVDVTNSDAGTIGSDGYSLFLAGYKSGSIATGYTYSCGINSEVKYTFSLEDIQDYGEDLLLMANQAYDPATAGADVGHTLEKTEARDSSCTSAGNSEYWTCTECDKYFSDELGTTEIAEDSWIIPAAHEWESGFTVDKKASPTEAGSKSKHCKRSGCSEKTEVTVIPKITSFELSETELTYNGEIQHPTVTVKDSAENTIAAENYDVRYSDGCDVVGDYTATVTFKTASELYTGTKVLTFKIKKAVPSYEVPRNLKAKCGDALEGVELPDNFSWQDAKTTSVGAAGENTFKVKFTPSDTKNYNVVADIEVKIDVSHNYAKTWSKNGSKHWHECTCGTKTDEAAHSGGTATCHEKAECEVCGAKYGELANHNPVHHDAVKETCTTDGNVEYYYCDGCKKYYSDEACTKELTNGRWIIKAHHNYSYYERAGGYMSDGEAYDICSVCGSKNNYRKLEGYSTSYVKSFKVTKGAKSFTAKWKKQSKAVQKKFAGYEITYYANTDKSDVKTVIVAKGAASKTIKKLGKKKKYYVEIRSYVNKNGATFYSKATKKTVTTK